MLKCRPAGCHSRWDEVLQRKDLALVIVLARPDLPLSCSPVHSSGRLESSALKAPLVLPLPCVRVLSISNVAGVPIQGAVGTVAIYLDEAFSKSPFLKSCDIAFSKLAYKHCVLLSPRFLTPRKPLILPLPSCRCPRRFKAQSTRSRSTSI